MADKYTRGITLGEGTWGQVYEAHTKENGTKVAIKRIKPMDSELGVNFTALREVKLLKDLHSAFIVSLLDVYFSEGLLHLVLEYCPYDLEKVIRDKTIVLKSADIKCYMQMILKGVSECHRRFVLHRDLKPANLLIDSNGVLKLADFGLARSHGSPELLTSEVVTRWYRAPELLFGAPLYAAGVDIWAVGCIFAELLFRVPLFPGNSDIEQLGKIFNLLGTPTGSTWPSVHLLPGYVEFEHREPMNLLHLFRGDNPQDLDLLLRMLTLNPLKRLTAMEALSHQYFQQPPLACVTSNLKLPVNSVHKEYSNTTLLSAVGNLTPQGNKRMKM